MNKITIIQSLDYDLNRGHFIKIPLFFGHSTKGIVFAGTISCILFAGIISCWNRKCSWKSWRRFSRQSRTKCCSKVRSMKLWQQNIKSFGMKMKGKENSGTWAHSLNKWCVLHISLTPDAAIPSIHDPTKIIIISWGDTWDKGAWQGPGGTKGAQEMCNLHDCQSLGHSCSVLAGNPGCFVRFFYSEKQHLQTSLT